jgi:hypothetical protein
LPAAIRKVQINSGLSLWLDEKWGSGHEPTLTIVCQPCGRRGRYNVERLMAKHGDAKILYLLADLTNCPKVQSTDIYDRCKARYEGLAAR